MAATATDITSEHYMRPEVKAAILGYCHDKDAVRVFNGDDSWYTRGDAPGEVRLTCPDDYDFLVGRFRTLYATIDLLDPSVMEISEPWNEEKGTPVKPIGTLAECRAFTLSVDIDSIKGFAGEDIRTSPAIKAAVEAAGKFFVDYLREHGITKSVHCLYSGGGIYVHLHHALFRAGDDWTPANREHGFRSATMAYNCLIAEIAHKFFEAHPVHKGRVKFDALNNQKRKFKTIFSLHRTRPVAVIPLDPAHILIDFERASLPLSAKVLAAGAQWYQSYDIAEKDALKAILAPFMEVAEKELGDRKERTGDYEIYRALEPIASEDFPPCIRNILEKAASGRGPHRALAVLASYLYQVGWQADEAFKLWSPIADRAGVEPRIFSQWYGQMSCPNCGTIQRESAGYPSVGLGGLGYCQKDGKCDTWPGDYGVADLI